jgi:hypothetical protein
VEVLVTVFLSFVPFPIPEPRIKDSRANNLQVEINQAGAKAERVSRKTVAAGVSPAI